jgi:hypothetical protein
MGLLPFVLPNYSDTNPAAPTGSRNAKWQQGAPYPAPDGSGNTWVDVSESFPNFGGVNVQAGTTYTLQASDEGQLVVFTAAGAVAVTLPAGLPNYFRCTLLFLGAAGGTLTPGAGAGTVNGVSSYSAAQNQGGEAFWNGANWWFVETGSGGGSVTASAIQNESYNYASDTGAANAYAVALSPAATSYVAGLDVAFKAANANTGASTLNVNSLGAKTVKKMYGGSLVDLSSGDISAGQIIKAKYDGTYFQVVAGVISGGGGASPPIQTGTPTQSGSPGQIVAVSDGFYGARLYEYIGAFAGLPLVVNWGTSSLSATGALTVNMMRKVTSGNFLVAVLFAIDGVISETPNTGWTSQLSNSTPTPAINILTKVAGATEAGNSAITPWSSVTFGNGCVAFLVEVANFNATTPAISYQSAGQTGIVAGSITASALILHFNANAGAGYPNQFNQAMGFGRIPLGVQWNIATDPGMAIGYACPIVTPFIGQGNQPTAMLLYDYEWAAHAVVTLSANGSVSANLWMPIG